MESALEEVAKHCHAELDTYAQCVDAKPSSWLSDCAALKKRVNECAATRSVLVSAIKERCRPQIEQYERCLRASPDAPSTCAGKLQRMWECTEGAHAAGQ